MVLIIIHHLTSTLGSTIWNNSSNFPFLLARSKAVSFWQLVMVTFTCTLVNNVSSKVVSSWQYNLARCNGVWPPDVCALMLAPFWRSTLATVAWSETNQHGVFGHWLILSGCYYIKIMLIIIQIMNVYECNGKNIFTKCTVTIHTAIIKAILTI